MNWVDLVVLAVIVLSGLLAFMRGLVREVLGVAAWVGAAIIASPYGVFPVFQPWARQQFSDPSTADIVAFGVVFIVALVVLWLLAGVLGNLVRGSVLGGLDRTLGLVFGLARGAVLVAAAYVLAAIVLPPEQWPVPVQEARALPLAYRGAAWLAEQAPPAYRPGVPPPPPGRDTAAAALLQPAPTGRAWPSAPRSDEPRSSQ